MPSWKMSCPPEAGDRPEVALGTLGGPLIRLVKKREAASIFEEVLVFVSTPCLMHSIERCCQHHIFIVAFSRTCSSHDPSVMTSSLSQPNDNIFLSQNSLVGAGEMAQ